MTVSVSKDTSFSSGAISFSALRLKFKKVSSGAVSLSELKRQTSTSLTNPVVANATENGNIPTTNSNIKLSDYRGSITYYYVTQTGTHTNFDIDAQSWNSNLGKNISKIFYVNGTLGATSTANYAATFDAAAFNLSIIVNGSIQGAGGAGGTSSSKNGKDGGPALYVRSNTSSGNESTRTIKLYNTQNIYAGGGGGGFGATGGTGGKGGQSESGQIGGPGGAGGSGGSGGRGRGYNQSRTNGSSGGGGDDGYLGSLGGGSGGSGGTGGTGGNGGDWGKDGTRGNLGSFGIKGTNAISGLYFKAKNATATTIPFTIGREAVRQSTIFVPGIAYFTLAEDNTTVDVEYDLSAGYYGIITGYENDPPETPPSASDWVKITGSGFYIGLDDNQGGNPDGDYQDLFVTCNDTELGEFGTFRPPAFEVPERPTDYGSGGSAGTRISGDNYTVVP